jgi:hypothetical protein
VARTSAKRGQQWQQRHLGAILGGTTKKEVKIMAKGAHDHRGRFTVGNAGGPGRPRRAVERDYLRALNAAVSLHDWREIVEAAVARAKEGDAKAREWLARYLLGATPPSLIDLTVDDVVSGGAGDGTGTELLEAVIGYLKKGRFRARFEAEDTFEANQLLGRSRLGELQDGEDGVVPSA